MNSNRTSVPPVEPGRNSFRFASFDPLIVSTTGRPQPGPFFGEGRDRLAAVLLT